MSTIESEVAESFDFDFGISSITKGAEGQKRMKLPITSSFGPSEGKVEEKLKKVINIGTIDSLIMQLLRPEIKDRSLLSPVYFREKIREIRALLKGDRDEKNQISNELCNKIDILLQEEENKSALLDQYRHMLLLG